MKKLSPFNQNLFRNNSDKVSFQVNKNQTVVADYFSLESEAKRAIRGRKAVDRNGTEYIQLQIVDQSVSPNTYLRGALFPNTKKQKGSGQPDMTGSVDLHDEGEEPNRMRLSAWYKEKKDGKAGLYLSIACQLPLTPEELAALKAKTPASEDGAAGLPPAGFSDDPDGNIPF